MSEYNVCNHDEWKCYTRESSQADKERQSHNRIISLEPPAQFPQGNVCARSLRGLHSLQWTEVSKSFLELQKALSFFLHIAQAAVALKYLKLWLP